jgi:hypothetical protein
MKITILSVEKSFTLSLNEGYRKVTAKAEATIDNDENWDEAYRELSDFVTDRMKEEKAKFTK